MSEKIKIFLSVWGIVLFLNQILFFGGTFAPYAIMAAIPHTFIIALVVAYVLMSAKKQKKDNDHE